MERISDKSVTTGTVTLVGDLTIENAQELHQKLLAALDQTTQLTVIFQDVTSVDLSLMQLFCSAHRAAVKAGKFFSLDRQRPAVLRQAVQEVGFLRDRGCVLDSQESCIWKEGWT